MRISEQREGREEPPRQWALTLTAMFSNLHIYTKVLVNDKAAFAGPLIESASGMTTTRDSN